jgi:hypothetical protein
MLKILVLLGTFFDEVCLIGSQRLLTVTLENYFCLFLLSMLKSRLSLFNSKYMITMRQHGSCFLILSLSCRCFGGALAGAHVVCCPFLSLVLLNFGFFLWGAVDDLLIHCNLSVQLAMCSIVFSLFFSVTLLSSFFCSLVIHSCSPSDSQFRSVLVSQLAFVFQLSVPLSFAS